MIQPKETSYKGYRFRSRLEARWVVFFDHLNFRWDYEYEGFQLKENSSYLPDFVLRNDGSFPDVWVEVKPNKPMTPSESKRYYQAATQIIETAEHTGFLVVMGDPLEAKAFLFGSFGGEKKLGPLDSEAFINFFAAKAKLDKETIFNAATAARSARFEHGESG